jgi:hypothetical protein
MGHTAIECDARSAEPTPGQHFGVVSELQIEQVARARKKRDN